MVPLERWWQRLTQKKKAGRQKKENTDSTQWCIWYGIHIGLSYQEAWCILFGELCDLIAIYQIKFEGAKEKTQRKSKESMEEILGIAGTALPPDNNTI